MQKLASPYQLVGQVILAEFKACGGRVERLGYQLLLIVTGLLMTFSASAATEQYPFSSTQQQADFNSLTHQMRCLVCQNQDLADSNAPLAVDLRNEIYLLVKQGHTQQEVIDYMTARYGDFVLYKPPLKSLTYVLWFAPFVMLVLSLTGLVIMVKRRHQQSKSS